MKFSDLVKTARETIYFAICPHCTFETASYVDQHGATGEIAMHFWDKHTEEFDEMED